MRIKNQVIDNSTGKYGFLPLSLILVLLIGFSVSGQIVWMIIFSAFIFVTSTASSLFWLKFLLPKHALPHLIKLTALFIFHPKYYRKRILSINNGDFKNDYDLILDKPKINFASIDTNSVLLIKDASNQLSIISHGTHIFKKEPEIIAIFDLSPRLLKIGPSNPDALNQKSFQESHTDYIERVNAAGKTKTQLSSGEFIYPFFNIIYRIETTANLIDDLQVILNISNFLKSGNEFPLCNRHLDLLICKKVLAGWHDYCQEKSKLEILNDFKGLFTPTDFSLKGIVLKVYVPFIL